MANCLLNYLTVVSVGSVGGITSETLVSVSSYMYFLGSLTDDERKLLEKHKELRRRFYELEDKAIELAESKWTITVFRRLLSCLPLKYRDDHIMFVRQEMPRFLHAETIQEIFSYLDFYWSYLSTDLLEYIHNELGDEESKQKLSRLNADVAEFRKMIPLNVYWKIEEIDPASKPIPKDLWQLVTVHKPESLSGKSTLDEVEQFRKQFASAFTIDKVGTLYLQNCPWLSSSRLASSTFSSPPTFH